MRGLPPFFQAPNKLGSLSRLFLLVLTHALKPDLFSRLTTSSPFRMLAESLVSEALVFAYPGTGGSGQWFRSASQNDRLARLDWSASCPPALRRIVEASGRASKRAACGKDC